MRETQEFEVDGLRFEFAEMPLEKTCKGAELVSELVAGAQGGTLQERVAGAAAKAISKLPALVDIFAPFCKVEGDGVGAGRKVPLGTFKGEVFNGRLDRAILFVAHCAAVEYADFLADGLERVGAGLADLVSQYPSLTARLPTSGD
jgi:hypothetical protein